MLARSETVSCLQDVGQREFVAEEEVDESDLSDFEVSRPGSTSWNGSDPSVLTRLCPPGYEQAEDKQRRRGAGRVQRGGWGGGPDEGARVQRQISGQRLGAEEEASVRGDRVRDRTRPRKQNHVETPSPWRRTASPAPSVSPWLHAERSCWQWSSALSPVQLDPEWHYYKQTKT